MFDAAVVFLHSPESALLQVDCATWKPPAAQDVFAVTALPSGAHFIGWRASEQSLTEGMMIWLSPRQVAVFEWNLSIEAFKPVRDEEELFRYQRGHDNLTLLQNAVVCPKDTQAAWTPLVYAITPPVIDGVQSSLEDTLAERVTQTLQNQELEQIDIDDFVAKTTDADPAPLADDRSAHWPLDWTDLPSVRKQLDTSDQLLRWIQAAGDRVPSNETVYNRELLRAMADKFKLEVPQLLWLGELQVAYVLFILGNNLSAFQQWKKFCLVAPLANVLFDEHVILGQHWIRCLTIQLRQTPEDFVSSDLAGENFVIAAALDTLEYTERHEDSRLVHSAAELKTALEALFKMSVLELEQLQQGRLTVVDGE